MPRSPTVWTLNDLLGQQELGLLISLKWNNLVLNKLQITSFQICISLGASLGKPLSPFWSARVELQAALH